MIGLGPITFAVWGYVIANTINSYVELNPVLIAAIFGKITPKEIEDAIDVLCQPDPKSRTPINDGRRLIREGQFQYFVPTHEQYRSTRNADDRRDYMRDYMRKRREDEKIQDVAVVKVNSKQCKPPLAHTEAETEAYTDLKDQDLFQEKPKASSFEEGDLKQARKIYNDLLQLNKTHKPPDFNTWANAIRLMREKDGKSLDEISALWSWANNDSFWQSNILSPDKLRKKWDQLMLKKNMKPGVKKKTYEDYQNALKPNEEVKNVNNTYDALD